MADQNKTPETPETEPEVIETAEAEVIETPEAPSADALVAAEREKHLRLAAEYDNFRKRSQRERENIYADVRADTITRFLPVYDNLVRALAQETADEAYKKGVEMIMHQLQDALGKLGVNEIPALGETFDPAVHNAVMHVDDETQGESVIVEEFQKGFKLGDKVIRFSMVKVAN